MFWDNLILRFLKRGKKLSRAVSRKGKWHPFLRDQLRRPSPTLSLLQLILSFNLFVIGPEFFNLPVHQIMANIEELSLYYEITSSILIITWNRIFMVSLRLVLWYSCIHTKQPGLSWHLIQFVVNVSPRVNVPLFCINKNVNHHRKLI